MSTHTHAAQVKVLPTEKWLPSLLKSPLHYFWQFSVTDYRCLDRRRSSSLSHGERKNQAEITMQKEQEKLERAKEILERRKSERDRLNAYMHYSPLGNPHSKHQNHLNNGMQRLNNTDGMFGRSEWTASLRSDYESLIKLREKEIAVATLKIENHKQLPCKSMQLKEDTVNKSDDPYLLNEEEFEFHQEALEQECGDNCFDKSNDSCLRNDMEDLEKLEHDLFSFENETDKYDIDTSTNLLLIEPTVFREHSFNGQRIGARSLVPMPHSVLKAVTPPLKSCLKSVNQKSISPTPKPFSQVSERTCFEASQVTGMATLDTENAIVLMSSAPHGDLLTLGDLEIMTVVNTCDTHEDINFAEDSFEVPFDLHCKEHLYPQAAHDLELPLLATTISNVESLKKEYSATDLPAKAFSEPEILRPKLNCQLGSDSAAVLPWSGIDTGFQIRDLQYSHASVPLDSFQLSSSILSALPPKYTPTSQSWQEEIAFDSSIPDESYTHHLRPSSERYENKNWGAEGESLIKSVDSEAATTRLLAEVAAIQSRLEDCKLKPWDFKDIFEGTYYPSGSCRRLEQHYKNEMIPIEDMPTMRFPPDDDHELVNNQNEEGTFDVNTQNHEMMPTNSREVKDSTLYTEFRIEQKVVENVIDAKIASSADDHGKEVLTTTPFSSDRKDNFTDMPILEEIQSTKKLHGGAWEIPWRSEGQQGGQDEPSADQRLFAGKNEQVANSTVALAHSKPAQSTMSVDFHYEKMIPSRVLNDQQLRIRHVMVQTDNDLENSRRNPHICIGSPGISTSSGIPYCDRFKNTANLSDHSLLSTERTSRYLNIGYRDLSVAPQTRHPMRSFFSSQGLLQVGYSQPRQSPQPVKQNVPQNNRQVQACGFRNSLCDKENWGMSGPDDQELSILASLERLNWKLAAISARAKNRTNNTPSLVSQDQISIQSAPAATEENRVFPDKTPEKFHVNQLRPSSVSTHKPTTRIFGPRGIVGLSNIFHQDIYN